MPRARRSRIRATIGATAAALLLTACSSAGPVPMTQQELDAPQSVPSIQIAAVAPSQAEAFADTNGFHLTCDAAPAGG